MKVDKYYQPSTLDELLKIICNNTGDAKIIAGGTDVLVAMRNRKISPTSLVDIGRIKELRTIKYDNGKLYIGSTVTFHEISENKLILKYIPVLSCAARQVGSPQIRNLGTIGGNVANCAAAGDTIPVLLALHATAIVADASQEREVDVAELLEDLNKSSLKSNEVIKQFIIPVSQTMQFMFFRKLGPRKALAISNLSLAMTARIENDTIQEMYIAAGAIGRKAYRITKFEEKMKGCELCQLDPEDLATEFGQYVFDSLGGRMEAPFKAGYKKNLAYSAFKSGIQEMKGGKAV